VFQLFWKVFLSLEPDILGRDSSEKLVSWISSMVIDIFLFLSFVFFFRSDSPLLTRYDFFACLRSFTSYRSNLDNAVMLRGGWVARCEVGGTLTAEGSSFW